MPDITTQPDQVAAYLAGVRERFAGVEQFRHLYVEWAAGLERTGGGSEYAWMARSLLDVPRLLAAVEAALKLHVPQRLYALSVMARDQQEPPRVWCGHTLDETDNDRHSIADDDSIICLDKHEATVCAECWEEGGDEQVEWPCPTYRDITAELLKEVPDAT